MTFKNDLIAYVARWAEVNKVQQNERFSASLQLRWQQLNSAYAMAKGLGLLQSDHDELEVITRWAKLKEKAASQKA